jgi:dipeptidyl-peptidase-4
MTMRRRVLESVVSLLLLTLVAPASAGEKKDVSQLTLERIFSSREFEPKSYAARWLKDGSGYCTTEESSETAGGHNIVCYDPRTNTKTIVVSAADLAPPGDAEPLKIDNYSMSKDRSLVLVYTNSRRVWRQKTRGDYWLLDRSSRQLRKLGGDAKPSTLMFAKISPSGRHVAFVRDGNIYVENLLEESIRPLTSSTSPNIINGTFDWVYEEEFGLRDGFRWSPDGKAIAYWQINIQGVREIPLVNNTDGLYPRITRIPYPKVGQRNPACRVGVVRLEACETHWLDVPGDPRDNYIARLGWAESSEEIALLRLNRLQNTMQVMLADVGTGRVQTILTERDEAWVDVHDEMKWFGDGDRFTWVSQRDGWRHGYIASRTGDDLALATPGEFDVIRILHVDEVGDRLYFLASPEDPTQSYLYRIGLDGTNLERVTPADQDGTHSYQISPDAKWAIHSLSRIDQPPTTDLVTLPEHRTVRVLENNKKLHKKFRKLRRQPTEFFRVNIGDNVLLDGWCIKPPDFDPAKKYPLLVYVYGEPAGQTVRDCWGGSNYLWHLMLAQRGYIVMSFDNRGTPAPRGRAWRKCVYRKIGVIAPQDQAAAVKTVIERRPYIDSERIGVWGWSGGGSMTLNAMFKYPDLYKTGISVAPVPNQRYYDTIYQERYMGLPNDNVEGFMSGSAINFAHQLKGNLLLIHGTGDDNCHYQTTEMLINELIRHNKRFAMMAYPNRTHAIREGKNTTRHLRGLMTRYLEENLPAGPRGELRSNIE